MFRFTNFAVAGLTALSMTLTPISANAAPDGEDYAKAIAGIVFLGLVGSAINDHGSRKIKSGSSHRNPYSSIEGSRSPRVIEGEIYGRKKDRFPGRPGARRVPLPGECALTLSTDRRDRTVFGRRCLKRNFAYADQLPRDCQLKVRTDRGVRTVYGARCLRRAGWRVAGY